MTPEQIAEMTGANNVQSAPKLVLNEVLLNGDPDVGAYRKRIWIDKGEGKPDEEELGKNINMVWLKIRRKLVERGKKGEIIRSTNEHNSVNDDVRVYEEGKEVFNGSAKEARERFEGLRTVQVVYALLLHATKEPELVRLTVKGASLGSDAKDKNTMTFYQYVSLFDEEPIINYVTQLGAIREEGVKPYFAMTFNRGPKVTTNMPLVLEKLQFVHEYTTKGDAAAKATPAVEAAITTDETMKQIQDEVTEEINPEDIPF